MSLLRKWIVLLSFLLTVHSVSQAKEYQPNLSIQNVETDIVYGEHERCRLDVMWPKGAVSNLPVVVWFHGGGLTNGDKYFITIDDQNIVQVAVRYPFIKGQNAVTPQATLDAAAQAVAWVMTHVEKYCGDRKNVVISGHSAGGYITMMLAMDPKYLSKYGISPLDLAGAVPLSGQATKHFNVRAVLGDEQPQFQPIIDELAPLGHVAEKTIPPMLLVCGDADADEWKCRAEENQLLAASIRACNAKADVEYVALPRTNHGSMRFPGYMYIRNFLRRDRRMKTR